jgi:acetoin utilization deacetylase AcuC-like enzyme
VKAFATDAFEIPLPLGHRFPMAKYAMLRERVLAQGLVAPGDVLVPDAATPEQLARSHDAEYVRRVFEGALTPAEVRALGFAWSPGLVERSRRSVGATIAACRAALEEGVAVNLAGGTHHAFRDRGEGWCVFNDASVAARAVQAEGRARRVVVLDLDVHQGNGTASIHRDDPSVFTMSVHAARNFPARKESSDLDVELADGTEDGPYLDAVATAVSRALSAGRADLAIYLAGADPYEDDALGRLGVTMAGLAERDRLVFAACRAAGAPVAVVMAGGYARRIQDTVAIHAETVRQARVSAA